MKQKLKLLLSILVLLLVVVACTPDPTVVVDQDPVISGAVDKTINRGATFVPLAGITATDDEDGDLTSSIVYSGNVNPNVAGVYQATYTVTDSAGNTKSVTISITVVIVDTEEPLISGAGDITVMLGDPLFTVLGGVTANDTIDGDITDEITYTGTVNLWAPGEYTINYSVEDAAGNEATKARKVTVSLGYFAFLEENALLNGDFATDTTNWDVVGATGTVTAGIVSFDVTAAAKISQDEISGGFINTDVADFTLAKLVINAKASAARNITATLSATTTQTQPIALTTTMTEFVQYFRMTAELDMATFELDLGNAAGTVEFESIELFFGVSSDDEDPVLTVPDTEVAAPINNLVALQSLVLRGVSAMDNIDGNITSRVTLDLDGIDITVPGTVSIPITVSDNAGNETVINRTVHLNIPFNTNVIDDPSFDAALDANQWGLSGGSEQVTLYNENGNMILNVVSPGGWDSATSPFLRNVTTNDLVAGNYYMFKFDVKADKARQMRIRAGLELWADPWIEDFQDGAVRNLQYQVTTEWQTIYYVFYIDEATSSAGSNVLKFEIKLGTITWGSEESNNKIYLDNAQFYLLSMEDEDPVIHLVPDQVVTFAAGATAPDWKTYVTISDLEDGSITVTDAMVDATDVNMNVAGTYDVVYTVTDNGGNTVTRTIVITILQEADTTAPVLTLNALLDTEFDQFEVVVVDLTAYVTANDAVDGAITILSSMIDDDDFSLNVAGTYTVVYTVSDSSGNTATLNLVLTVVDKEAPVVSGATDLTITLGDTFDPLAGVTAMDNVDGAIVLTIANVSGHEAFLNESNVSDTAGVFEVTYSVVDALGNTREQVRTITVLQIEFDLDQKTDLLALAIPVQNDGGTIESVGVYNVDGSLNVTYNGVKGWYGSYSKITYSNVSLLEGRMYKLVVEAKAATARDILVRFVGADNEAVTAFTNRKIVSLGTEYAVYELIFALDKTGPYNIQIQFGWEGNLTNVNDANVIDIKQFQLIPEYVIEYDLDNASNLLGLQTAVGNDGSNIESVGVYNVDGSLTVTYNGVKGWYGSYSKITYYQSVTEGLNYKLLIEAKAATARDILIRFVDGAGVAVPGFENRYKLVLGTDYQVTELLFVAPSTGTFNLQLQFGWESNLTNAEASNVIDIKQFLLISEMTEVVVEDLKLVINDLEGYADQAAFDVDYAHRISGANHSDAHVTIGAYGNTASKGIMHMIGEHGITGWDLVRTKANFDNTGLTNDYLYFAFWYKGDPSITTIYLWLYWSGSQNSQPIDVSSVPAEGGYVYIPIASYGKVALDIIQYAVGYNLPNNTMKATVYYDEFMFITNPSVLEPVENTNFVLDSFNDYADQSAMEVTYTHRVPSAGANHNDAHITLGADYGVDGSKGIMHMIGEHAVTGWDLVRTKANFDNTGLTNDYLYFAFWFKGDGVITSISLWLYWSGSQNSQTIDVSGVPAGGGYVYVLVSAYGKTATEITQYAVGYNHTNTTFKATVYYDDFMFIKSPADLA